MVNPYTIHNPTMGNPYTIRNPTMGNPYTIRNPTMGNPCPICVRDPTINMTKCNTTNRTGIRIRMLDQAPWPSYYRNTNHR